MSRVLKSGEPRITQGFSSAHTAVDLVKAPSLTDNITAHSAGKVVFCQKGHKNAKGSKGNASYGNCVKIDHGDGYFTLYAHLSKVDVNLSDRVTQGQIIGYMGDSGNAYGAHLHFEVFKGGARIDPTPFLNADLPIAKPASAPVKTADKSVDELAKEVIRGDWGNGRERADRLTAAGHDYNAVQARVDELLGAAKPAPALKSTDEIAHEVIKGLWGNGQDRKNRLSNAGYDYNAVQKRVNELLGG